MISRQIHGAVGGRPARTFVRASTQYLLADTGFGLTANSAVTICLTAARTSNLTTMALVTLGVSGSANDCVAIQAAGADTVACGSRNAASTTRQATSAAGAFTSGAGYISIVGSQETTTSRWIYTNGVGVQNTQSSSLSAPTAFSIGVTPGATNGTDANIGCVAIFAGAATPSLVALHAAGVHPTRLPGTLMECWDLDRVGVLVGLVRGTVLTPTNGGGLTLGPTQAQGHQRRVWLPVGDVFAGGTTYQESLALSASHGLDPTTRMTLQGAVAMTAEASVAEAGLGAWQSAVSLSASTAITPSAIATLAAQFALTADVTLVPAATLIAQCAAVLSASTALSVSAGAATYTEALALEASTALVPSAVVQMLASMGVSASTALDPAASLTHGTTLALGLSTAIDTAAAQMHAAAVALEAATGIAAASRADYQASISLAVATVLQTAGSIVGAPTYAVLLVAAETLRAAAATGDTLTAAAATDEELIS